MLARMGGSGSFFGFELLFLSCGEAHRISRALLRNQKIRKNKINEKGSPQVHGTAPRHRVGKDTHLAQGWVDDGVGRG